MKKSKHASVSALVIIASLVASSASAVSLNPKGIGQVLFYPYYTVNKNQDTLISVANTSDVGKVVRVEFLEGINGRDVSLFTLFLSPHDVWTASITQTADDGGAQLLTTDRSCTYPILPTPLPFRSDAYDGTGPVPGDGGPQSITRTREGYVAAISMGDIVPGSPTDVRTRHAQDGNAGAGTPPGCDEINNVNVVADVVAPSNALYGSAAIVNVGEGTYFAYNADAVAGYTDIPLISSSAQFTLLLQNANSAEATNGVARAYVSDNDGRPIAIDYEFGIDALSAIFMSDALYNEYLVDSSLGANTDWVVTFPTKPFYTDTIYGSSVPSPPFDEAFVDGAAPVEVDGTIYDREEGATPLFDCDICPPPTQHAHLAYAVNVLSFVTLTDPAPGTPSGVFGSVLTSLNVPPYGGSGAVTLNFLTGSVNHQLPGGIDSDGNEVTLIGLPATGFMSYNIINTQAQPGMLANYGGSFHHRATMTCIGPADVCERTNSGASGN